MSARNNTDHTIHRTSDIYSLFPQIVDSALAGDRQRIELLVLKSIRAFRRDNPELSNKLGDILSHYSTGSGVMRGNIAAPLPADQDAGMALIRIDYAETALEPVLSEEIQKHINRFIAERAQAKTLLNEGFSPPRSVLLKGLPGTGKTMLGTWLAKCLELPIVTLDLATSISSFLGKTGFNLRRSLDYARANPCVLLLDEFDSIAKRRDDSTEVGELKRIVNVLLKELEDWPIHSVLVAATNHPKLLDPAIERRFDVVWDLPLPGEDEIKKIVELSLGRFASELTDTIRVVISRLLKGYSGSELTTMSQAVVRNHLISRESILKSLVEVLRVRRNNHSKESDLIQELLEASGNSLTQRELAEIFNLSPSTINYHLNKDRADDQS